MQSVNVVFVKKMFENTQNIEPQEDKDTLPLIVVACLYLAKHSFSYGLF